MQPIIAANVAWTTLEEFDYAQRPNQAPIHFKLELPEGRRIEGDFNRIHLQSRGRPDFVLDNDDGWIAYNHLEQPSEAYAQLQKRSLVSSKYVLILPASQRNDDPPLIFLRSWGYASDAERLHVIGFQPSGDPILLINTELDLTEVTDLDGDGRVEIVGIPCMSQTFGNGLLTYDPIHVYHIPYPITSPAKLSLPLTRSYNLKHYFGWAGPDCREDVAVVLHPPGGGKPLIMNTDEARKLTERN